MVSKRNVKDKQSVEDGEILVVVRCLQNNIYGEAGEMGYIPESMVDAWVAKGRVAFIEPESSVKKKSVKSNKVKSGGLPTEKFVSDSFSGEGSYGDVKNNEEGQSRFGDPT